MRDERRKMKDENGEMTPDEARETVENREAAENREAVEISRGSRNREIVTT